MDPMNAMRIFDGFCWQKAVGFEIRFAVRLEFGLPCLYSCVAAEFCLICHCIQTDP